MDQSLIRIQHYVKTIQTPAYHRRFALCKWPNPHRTLSRSVCSIRYLCSLPQTERWGGSIYLRVGRTWYSHYNYSKERGRDTTRHSGQISQFDQKIVWLVWYYLRYLLAHHIRHSQRDGFRLFSDAIWQRRVHWTGNWAILRWRGATISCRPIYHRHLPPLWIRKCIWRPMWKLLNFAQCNGSY